MSVFLNDAVWVQTSATPDEHYAPLGTILLKHLRKN